MARRKPPACQKTTGTGKVNLLTFKKLDFKLNIAVAPDDENVEIISCDTVQAIKRFKEGDMDQIGDLRGHQLTEAVDTARKLVTRLTDAPKSTIQSVDKVIEATASSGSSYRIYSNSESTLIQLEQRVARLEELGKCWLNEMASMSFLTCF